MKKRSLQTYLAFTLMATTVSLMTSGCSSTAQVASGQEGIAVKVIKVGSVSPDHKFSGKFVADQEVNVVSKISGKVAAVNVKEGDQVKQGEELVKLESDDYVAQLNQAQAALAASQAKLADTQAGARSQQLDAAASAVSGAQAGVEQAKAAMDLAQTSFNRTKSLFDAGAAPQSDLDTATNKLETAKAAYTAAQSQLNQSQANLDLTKAGATQDTIKALQADVNRLQAGVTLAQNAVNDASIKSPIDGVVAVKSIDPGEMANPGAALLTVVQLDHLMLQVSVPQDQINNIKKGAAVAVQVNGFDQPFKGVVDFVSPVSDATNNTFPVKVKVENPNGALRTGMMADVLFDQSSGSEVEIPKAAIITKDNKSYIYKVESGAAHLTEIKTKDKDQNWVYAENGVNQSDQIIINPSEQLKDGAKVQVS